LADIDAAGYTVRRVVPEGAGDTSGGSEANSLD
jgi:hypothetical protein